MFKKMFLAAFVIALGAVNSMASRVDTGVVIDNSGTRVAGASVTYTRGSNVWNATTDANGVYRFTLGFQATLDTINSSGTAGTLTAAKTGYVMTGPNVQMTVAVTDTVVNATPKGNNPITLTVRTTTGSVVDSFSTVGVSGAKIRLKRAGAFIDSATTDANGAYTLSRVMNRDTLVATASGYFQQVMRDSLTTSQTASSINFKLTAYGAIAGIITADSLNGQAISGATVAITKVGATTPLVQMNTNAQGRYSFDSLLAYVGYKVSVSAANRLPSSMTIPQKKKGIDSANVFLLPTTSGVTGTVTSDNSSKLKGAKLVLQTGGKAVDSTTSDANGAYAFNNVSVGVSYQITASANGFANNTITFTKSAATDVVNITLVAGSTKSFWVKVLGQVAGGGTAPLANASVGFTNAGTVLGAITNPSGVAKITGAKTGFDTLTMADSGYYCQQQFPTINAYTADTLTYTLTALPGGTVQQKAVRGTVRLGTPNNGPVQANATILFKCAGNWVFCAVSNTTGNYSVVGIQANSSTTATVTAIPTYNALTGMGLTCTPASLAQAGWKGIAAYTNPADVSLGTGTTTSTTYNIVIPATGTLPENTIALNHGVPSFSIHAGKIALQNMNQQGVVRVTNLQGRVLFAKEFAANTSAISIPKFGKSALIVSVSQKANEIRQLVTP